MIGSVYPFAQSIILRSVSFLDFIRFKREFLLVADLSKYPNPLRLFTQTRDEWFTDFVVSFDIPMHIFSAVRDTQLGQLMFAIETVRMKKKRAGEDPGPGLLEGENATMFIPLFRLIKQFQDIIAHEDLNLDSTDIYSSLLPDSTYDTLSPVHKTGQEWFVPLAEARLDQLYLACAEVFREGFIQPLLTSLEVSDTSELQEKLSEVDADFGNTIFNLYDPDIIAAIKEENYEVLDDEQSSRMFTIDDEEISLSFNEYHGRVNLLYSFLLELKRFISDTENYNYNFEMLEPLLSLEMLIMFPQPDTSRLPLVKTHLSRLAKKSSVPQVFFDVLSQSYQSFCRIEEANARLVRKLFSTLEKTMKDTVRDFWKQAKAKLEKDDPLYEPLIAIIWSHLRAIQSQAQYREQQPGQGGHNHSQTHAITIRLEHIFWIAGRFYVEADQYTSSYQFWSAYAAIANKQVRNKEDSLDLFHELDHLLGETEVLTSKKKQKQLVINHADQYSLIQRLLSYGLEARTDEIYDQVEDYLVLLESLLADIDPEEMHESFDLDQEKKVVGDIRQHMKNPIQVDNA